MVSVPSAVAPRIELACDAYKTAVFRFDLGRDVRESAAAQFKSIAAGLAAAGDAGAIVAEVVARMSDEDAYKAGGAARLLTELPFREATEALLAAYARGQIVTDFARYLGRAAPLKEEDWDALPNMHSAARPQLVFALLRSPSAAGRRRFAEILAAGNDVLCQAAIAAVARWHEPRLLRMVLETWKPAPADVTPFDLPELHPLDVRLDAAFRLALDGDRPAVDFLMEAATPRTASADDRYRAVDAVIHLGALAWPGAVPPVAALLQARSKYVLEMTLDAVSALQAAALVPALLDLAARAARSTDTAEQALLVAEEITGREASPSQPIETATGRQRMIMTQRTALLDLDPALRYLRGAPLTLDGLVANLTSMHDGPVRAAAYNLRALTGEDGGFDPDDDLIENLAGLAFWRARARRPGPIEPGGWAFAGDTLPPPRLPDSVDQA